MTKSAFYYVFLMQVEYRDFLVFEGEIFEREIKIDEENKVVKVSARAKMQAENKGKGTVELINPKYFSQSKTKHFATTKEDCRRRSNLYSAFYSDDILFNDDLIKLESDLKSGKKLENFFIKLEQNEKYIWDEKIYFEFDLIKKTGRWQTVSWNEMLEKADSFWFQYEYRLPEKFESLKPKLFEIFDENWKKADKIPIARFFSKDINSELLMIDTRPIFIKLTE